MQKYADAIKLLHERAVLFLESNLDKRVQSSRRVLIPLPCLAVTLRHGLSEAA